MSVRVVELPSGRFMEWPYSGRVPVFSDSVVLIPDELWVEYQRASSAVRRVEAQMRRRRIKEEVA